MDSDLSNSDLLYIFEKLITRVSLLEDAMVKIWDNYQVHQDFITTTLFTHMTDNKDHKISHYQQEKLKEMRQNILGLTTYMNDKFTELQSKKPSLYSSIYSNIVLEDENTHDESVTPPDNPPF